MTTSMLNNTRAPHAQMGIAAGIERNTPMTASTLPDDYWDTVDFNMAWLHDQIERARGHLPYTIADWRPYEPVSEIPVDELIEGASSLSVEQMTSNLIAAFSDDEPDYDDDPDRPYLCVHCGRLHFDMCESFRGGL